jgi:DNA modification methylase
MSVRLLEGDCRAILPTLPADSVHCVVTSPPYWGLRDYGVDGQLGLEATPEEYVANMVAVFREVRRVLRADGTLWLNMGDSYSGGGGYSPDAPSNRAGNDRNGGRSRLFSSDKRQPAEGLKPKDLVGMPWRLAFALQADGWFLRADIIWAKPNPMPESVTDRPTKAHEYVFLLAKSRSYFYDADAVREKADLPTRRAASFRDGGIYTHERCFENGGEKTKATSGDGEDGTGRNLRSVWTIPSAPFPDAHFATFPPALASRCIQAGTSERGCCRACGAPWARQVETAYVKSPVHGKGSVIGRHETTGANGWDGAGLPRLNKQTTTTGWSPTCPCDAPPVPCTVLDPFAGSGTVGEVAEQLGRHSVLIELSPAYVRMADERTAQYGLFTQEAAAP